MRPTAFTDVEIIGALRDVKAGTPAVQVCRTMGISQTTFYRWRRKYDAAGMAEFREVTRLRGENQKLKQIVATLLLDKVP